MEAGPIALDDLKPGDEVQQSALWGRFKQRLGWCPEPVYWVAGGSGGTLLSLRHVTPLGPLVYVPGAPATSPARGDAGRVLADLAPKITAGAGCPQPEAGAGARTTDEHRAGSSARAGGSTVGEYEAPNPP